MDSQANHPPCLHRAVLAAAAVLLLAGCGGGPSAVRAWEDLDETSGVTVTRIAQPLVFFQDDSARAANCRDFVHVAPLQVGQGGRNGRWLWVAIWSTIDRRVTDGEPTAPETTAIRLVVDGEPMEIDLAAAVAGLPGVGIGPYELPVPTARVLFVPLTASQLARLGAADAVTLGVERSGEGERAWTRWPGDIGALEAMAGLVVPGTTEGPPRRP